MASILPLLGSIIPGVVGSALQAGGAKQHADAQADAARQNAELGQAFSENQLGLIGALGDTLRGLVGGLDNAFVRSDNVFSFLDDTSSALDKLFRDETAQKRENLAFIQGETSDELRTAQVQNAELATGNFSNFLDSLRADTVGILAGTEGRPLGAFENLAARNQLLARSRGLSNTLSINDFFAREGTVDPPSALSVFGSAAGVAEFEAREDSELLAFQERQLDRSLTLEESLYGKQFAASSIGLQAETGGITGAAASAGVGAYGAGAALLGVGQAANSFGLALANRDAAKEDDQTRALQRRLLQLQIDKLNNQAT